MKASSRRTFLQAAGGALAAVHIGGRAEAAYPNRPIRLVCPYPPGGPTDVLARLVAIKLGERLGQTIVIENKPGASGMIGADAVAKSGPDGYTLLANASIHVINPSLYTKTKYDAIADFAPISNLADVPLVLVVSPSVRAKSVKELIALAKGTKPLSFASSGNGAAPHLAGEAFKVAAKVDILHVPYKGSSPALTDLIGGQVDLMFDSLPSSMPFIKSGTLRVLAVTTARRTSILPEVPTMAESGLPGFDISTWYGIWAPAGTPAAITHRISREIAAIVKAPELRTRFAELGAQPVGSTPEEFTAFNKSELVKWSGIVKASGTKLD